MSSILSSGPPVSDHHHQPVSDVAIQQSSSPGQEANSSAHESIGSPSTQASARHSMSQSNGHYGQRPTPPRQEAPQQRRQGWNTRSNQVQKEQNNQGLPMRLAPPEQGSQIPQSHVLPNRLGPEQSPMKAQTQAPNPGQSHAQQSRYTQHRGPVQGGPPTEHRVQNVMQHRQTYQQGQTPSHGRPDYNPAPMVPHEAPVSNYTHRSIPQNRRLYDPRVDGSQQSHQARDTQQKYRPADTVRDQNLYLEALASVEVPKAEMGQQELEEKESLRLSLEQICRDAVTQYERKKNKEFDESTVVLKCFGSLSSGFATHSSDMDLAILSPESTPALSSNESEIPRLLEKALLDLGFGARLLTRARVPIIKFCEKPTPELVKALLGEREKWEKERDAPPKPKVEKSSTKKGEESKKKSNKGEESKTVKSNKAEENVDSSQKSGENDALNEVPRSDAELVFLYNLAMDEGWYDAEERKIIKNFCSAVSMGLSGWDDDTLQKARLELNSLTKILHKYRAPVENQLDFPKSGVGIQCDINFSNPLALHNTLLLKCYSLCDPRIRPMILFVKAWAKRRKINSPYHGTLSSYGYVLMVLHYVVNIANPSIAPNLQTTRKAAHDDSPGNDAIIDGYNVRFWRSEAEIQDLARHGMLTRNLADTVGSLLRGFFHYYAQQGFYSPSGGFCWAKDVLSLRTERGILSKQAKDWTGAKTVTIEPTVPGGTSREIRHRYLLAIEDPFETDHNIARTVVHNGIIAIRDEFRRANWIIQSVGRPGMQDLFAEAENREHLGRRAFGPLPRKDNPATQSKDQPAAGPSSKDEQPISGASQKSLTGSLPEKGEPGCNNAERPAGGCSSEGKVVRTDKDQPAKKAVNGNRNSSHNKNMLVKEDQVPSVTNKSSPITPASRESVKSYAKRRPKRDKEHFNRQSGNKRGPFGQGKPGPPENPSPNDMTENKPPPHLNSSSVSPTVTVTALSVQEPSSSESEFKTNTQESTYMHQGLVCNIQAPSTLTRDSAPTSQDSRLSAHQDDISIPDENSNDSGTGAVAGSLESSTGGSTSTTAETSPEA
ncbi:hypothetical protein MMC07_004932 [Pseudocyphellaria aurata]|nr:hypothetical protein [Pseudocyphellaria aurata]